MTEAERAEKIMRFIYALRSHGVTDAGVLRAMERRQRELVMTGRGRLGLWLKLIAPGLVDRLAERAVREKG